MNLDYRLFIGKHNSLLFNLCGCSKCHISLDPKEQQKLDKIADESGLIKKDEFVEFAKKSAAVKDLGLRDSKASTPTSHTDIDKAAVVFKVHHMTHE